MSVSQEQKDFGSNDGFSVLVWGPALWHVMHTVSFNFPVDPTPGERAVYQRFFATVGFVLPCGACRLNYPKNTAAVRLGPHVFQNRFVLSRYVYQLHQEVHRRTQGRPFPVSFKQLRANYEKFRAQCLPRSVTRPHTPSMEEATAPLPSQEPGCLQPTTYRPPKLLLRVVDREQHQNTSSFTIEPLTP